MATVTEAPATKKAMGTATKAVPSAKQAVAGCGVPRSTGEATLFRLRQGDSTVRAVRTIGAIPIGTVSLSLDLHVASVLDLW